MKEDPFHQMIDVKIIFKKPFQAGKLNRLLKGLGAKLHYDVYSFERSDEIPIWQSESFVYVSLFYEGAEVDAQDTSDSMELSYPLATIGTEYIVKFAEVMEQVSKELEGQSLLNGVAINKEGFIAHCDELATELMQEWGEEPGSETLRILIESNY